MAQIPQNPPFLLDSLYCQEDNYSYFEDEQQESYHIDEITADPPQKFLEQDLFWEDEELTSLLSKERENPLFNHTEKNPSLIRARNDAVEWILSVNAYFSFSALTSLLAVDYLDRFLFNFHFQKDKPWMTQLAAVACLSLAAKVEETQVEESRYVFEAKTIQRMEVLVLSSLQWRMNPVTPVSFLDHIIRRLGFKDYYICFGILRRCESLFLSIISDSKLMCYLPSVLATATMLHVINGVAPSVAVECQNQLLGTLGIDKDKVEDCYKLILESTSGFLSHQSNKRKFRSMPGSPNGVTDVCFSSDSSNDSWAVTASVSSSPEPLSKKLKAQDHHFQSLNHGASDILSFPL
ncbi:hypothetical protein RHMOL_Rhmol06G0067100 [Rhododendron molle]|uniref:Uncharacterized protein n=1 Tax=Rhododendron molle TaxID=49168 RepID=A0ACC0N9W8_RHOML|nr:hypothetical protein RHMOL_Rhmol06G0067100 [Rhododendron molle]